MWQTGRTRIAKRHTAVVTTDGYLDDVLPDWSGFKKNERIDRLNNAVAELLTGCYSAGESERRAQVSRRSLKKARGAKMLVLHSNDGRGVAGHLRARPVARPDLLEMEIGKLGGILLVHLNSL